MARSANNLVVDPIDGYKWSQDVPQLSTLFRKDAFIDVVCNESLARNPALASDGAADPLRVLSVGCSFGAEVDTILAHYNGLQPPMHGVHVTGIDVHQPTLEQAKKGIYKLVWYSGRGPMSRHESMALFSDFKVRWVGKRQGFYEVQSIRLRNDHVTEFRCADLSREKIELPFQDIIFCNNVMRWLQDNGQYIKLFKGMIPYLRSGGIMSLGEYPLYKANHDVISTIADEAGLVPTLRTDDTLYGQPFAFHKPGQR